MAKKVWNLNFVPGNPAMFSRVVSCSENPMSRAEALKGAETIARNSKGGWRVWVEHHASAERIFESEPERAFRAAGPGASEASDAAARSSAACSA